MEMDVYSVLGVQESASKEEVRAAYFDLAKKYHPDRNVDDPVAEQRFLQIKEAYAVLTEKFKNQSSGAAISTTISDDGTGDIRRYAEYYEVLQLESGATNNEVQHQYHHLKELYQEQLKANPEQLATKLNSLDYAYTMLTGKKEQDPNEW